MNKIINLACVLTFFTLIFCGCKDTESYSDLLRDEEKAVNWYLSGQRVESQIPADSVFETGANAPYYRMDEDGFLYMQVVNAGNKDQRAQDGDMVYFRYMRKNLKYMYEGYEVTPDGNADNLDSKAGNTSFKFGNTSIPSSAKWGTGIQIPLQYLGYGCEVNIVMRSYIGFVADQTECIPYVVNVRYFKPEY